VAGGFGGSDIQRFSDGFRPAAVVVQQQQQHRSSVAWKADDSHFGRTMRLSSSSSNNRRSNSKNDEDVKDAETADEGMMFPSQADAEVPSWHATATTSSSIAASSSSFNPFAYDASTMGRTGGSSSTSSAMNNVVSLRSLQMKDFNDQLLAAASIDERYEILVAHRDLLLAPVVDGDTAVGDNIDSIYRHCSTISERYNAFATSLTARIERAQSPLVRTILQEMKDYVMAQQPEHERPEPSET
jgi:hypothetical protein